MSLPVVYGASWCHTCQTAKEWLAAQGVEYQYVDADAQGLEMKVPTLKVNGRVAHVGFNPAAWGEVFGVPAVPPARPKPPPKAPPRPEPAPRPATSPSGGALPVVLSSVQPGDAVSVGLYGDRLCVAIHNPQLSEAQLRAWLKGVWRGLVYDPTTESERTAKGFVTVSARAAGRKLESLEEIEQRLRAQRLLVTRLPGG